MSNIFFGIITLSIVAAAFVFVYVMIEVRGTVKAIKEFLKTTEDTLNPTLEELRKSLKSLRNVTDNTTAITEDVRTLSASVREVGKDIMHVSKLVNGAASSSFFCVTGLRAGIKAATEVLVRGILNKKAKA
jgi:uncharacterized protein YoxC